MAKQEPEYLLRVTIDVLYRASQEQITNPKYQLIK